MAKKNNRKGKQVITNTPNGAKRESKKCKERRNITVSEALSIIISFLALGVSIVALIHSDHYSELEYKYKVDPQIEITGRPEIKATPSGGPPFTTMGEIQVSVVEKNNLDSAFIIYGDNRVERLELDDMEGTLEGKIKSGVDTKADIVSGEWEYRYFFLCLESLDGETKLYLIYTKSLPGFFTFNAASGIEVYGLEKADYENEADYVGEKLMARKYVQLLKELPEYRNQ